MAKVNQRLWKAPGQRAKRKAWGYTLQVEENGQRKQKRCYKAEWTREDAEAELAKQLLKIEPVKPKGAGITLKEAAETYLRTRTNRGNPRSKDEKRTVAHLK